MKDKIVEEVVLKYQQRSEVGIKKYGTTLEQNNKDNYLVHLQEELMDATLYIQKLLSKVAKNTSFDNHTDYPELEGTMNLCEEIISNRQTSVASEIDSMTIQEAIHILTLHQAWRLGSDIPMVEPKQLSKAIHEILYYHMVNETKQ